MNLQDYESVKRWHTQLTVKSGGRKTSTIRIWDHYLEVFCEKIAHKTPDELIDERRQHLKSDDMLVRRQHEELVIKFIMELLNQKAPPNTINTAVAGIRSFYNRNYAPLDTVETPRGISVRPLRIPSREDLKAICEVADSMTRAWVCCQKDCGISIGDLLTFQLDWESPILGTVKQQLSQGRCPLHLHTVRGKTQVPHDTFLGEDAIKTLQELQPENRVFRVSDKTIRTWLDDASEKANLGFHLKPHSLRKFFSRYLSLAGVNDRVIEYWQAHSLGAIRGTYFGVAEDIVNLPPLEEQMQIYQNHYKAIKVL